MKIVTDEKILRQISEPYNPDEHNLESIIKDLKEAVKTAWSPGCGLAAIQIGIPIRVAWFVYEGVDEILINPEITYRKHRKCDIEGCLSIPYIETPVTRSKIIHYISNGEEKIAKGFKARIIQHEIDHMNGILNTDTEANK
jgi:peptide deformylase